MIRFALDINPTTAQVEVAANGSDPIPHIIDGIVVHVRDIRVYMDRNNSSSTPPTATRAISEDDHGAGADPANPADQAPVTDDAPFQAADCSSLQFKPAFKVSTSGEREPAERRELGGKAHRPRRAWQRVEHPSRQSRTPQTAPVPADDAPKACLARSSRANPAGVPTCVDHRARQGDHPDPARPTGRPRRTSSPTAAKRSPASSFVLQGYGFTIDLTGTTYISKQGVTSSTFKTVPDQPVTSFELTLPQGPDSALAALGNPCKNKLRMPTEFIAQNGATIHQSTKIAVTGCPKAKKATHKKKKKKGKKGGHSRRKGR